MELDLVSPAGHSARPDAAASPEARRGWQPLWHPYGLVLRLSLALSLVAGFGLGLYLLLGLALRFPLPPSTPALLQAHGQAQALGLMLLFVLAVGVHLFPRFHARPLDRPIQVSVGALLLTSGVTLRAVAQPFEPSVARGVAVVVGALLALVGALLALEALGRVVRRGETGRPERVILPMAAGLSLLGALLLNVIAAIGLAAGGLLVPAALDEAYLHLALWGFAASMILVVAGRVYATLLLLRPEREALVRPMQVFWLVGSLGVPLAWLLAPGQPVARAVPAAAQLLGALLFVVAIRLYEPPRQQSGMPWVTNPTRTWARTAFAFLLLGALLNVVLPLAESFGSTVPATAVSAARHALAQGFLVPVMVYMAARILPGYSAQMLRRGRLLGAIMASLFVGAALRVAAELVGGYDPVWGPLVALGATLETLGFTAFAYQLWRQTPLLPAR